MTTKQATLRNYEVFMPILESLPYTHRYWSELRSQYFPQEEIVDERVAGLILAQLTNVLNRVADMTDEFFDDCECKKKPCLMFHNQDYPVIQDFTLDEGYRLKTTILNDVQKKYKVEVIHENTLDNPLIIEQHIMYGGVKMETRFKDNNRQEIETVIEEV
jgi:hypothetical protein